MEKEAIIGNIHIRVITKKAGTEVVRKLVEDRGRFYGYTPEQSHTPEIKTALIQDIKEAFRK
jgi:hypothetical protein